MPPWWLVAALVLGLLALAALSTVLGLQQVRISPLGVATRQTPRAAWRNVSAVALLGMIAALVGIAPTASGGADMDAFSVMLLTDIRTGVIVTLAVGLVVAATSTLVNQGALVFDRAAESVALDHAGVPRALFGAVRRRQVLVPLVATLGISIATGLVLATPFLATYPFEAQGAILVGATALVGVLLTLAAAEACRPLQSHVLDSAGRRND